jgi:hypothetical protein
MAHCVWENQDFTGTMKVVGWGCHSAASSGLSGIGSGKLGFGVHSMTAYPTESCTGTLTGVSGAGTVLDPPAKSVMVFWR